METTTAPISTSTPAAAPVAQAPSAPINNPAANVEPIATNVGNDAQQNNKSDTNIAQVAENKNEAPAKEPAKTSTLLGDDTSSVAKETEVILETKEPASQSVEPAPLPTYEAFVLPDTFKADEAKIGDFTNALAEFEIASKADHAEVQKLGQALLDRHVMEVKNQVEALQKLQNESWENTKNEWRKQFESDPEIGGKRMETTVNAAREFIRTHGGTPEQQTQIRQMLDITGAGNHPAMIRLLAQAAKSMQEGKPLPANKPVQSQVVPLKKKMFSNFSK